MALHVSFALLLIFAIVRCAVGSAGQSGQEPITGAARVLAVVLACLMGVLYLAGTVFEKRAAQRGESTPATASYVWVAGVLAIWVALITLSIEFAWVVFPLFFVVLHIVVRPWSYLVLAGLVIVVGWSFMAHSQSSSPALLIGPLVGASAAAAMYWIYSQLVANVQEQQRTIADLEFTRAVLARTEHEAGRLAERERVARDIHDTLAQGFSSIILMKRGVDGALGRGEIDLAKERLEVIGSTAAENLAQARDFVAQLRKSPHRNDVVAALREQVQQVAARAAAGGSPTHYEVRAETAQIPCDAQLVGELANAVHALLSNVEQHAQARTCVVSIADFGSEVVIDLFDDGVGFDASALAAARSVRAGGFGLVALRERMAALGGSVHIESAVGHGTVVTLTVPSDHNGKDNDPVVSVNAQSEARLAQAEVPAEGFVGKQVAGGHLDPISRGESE